MIPKIKMLGKKVISWGKGLLQKLHQQLQTLWSASDSRILLILIAAVLALLILAVILLFGIEWKTTVGICYGTPTDPSNAAYRQLLEQSLTQRGFEVVVTDASGDQARQLEQIENLRSHRCKAMLIEPVMVTAGEELSRVLEKQGVPIVLLNRQPEGLEHMPFVGADPMLPGHLLGQMVGGLSDGGDINGDGVVSYLLVQGAQKDSAGALLAEGFAQNVENCQQLSVSYGNWTKNDSAEACSQQLATYGKDIEVILCSNDAMAVGAAAAVSNGGWQVGEDVYLFGFGGDAECLQMIRDQKLTGTVHVDMPEQVSAVIHELLAQMGGQTTKTQYQPSYTAVTAENADEFLNAE